MLIKKNNHFILEKLTEDGRLVQGLSTRFFGSLKLADFVQRSDGMKKFASAVGFDLEKSVAMRQVHSNRIASVGKKDWGKVIGETDGLVTGEPEVFLLVRGADCPSIFFYDPKKNVIAVVHSGWRGTLSKIGGNMVRYMEKEYGCRPSQILVGTGPSIGSCCYNVSDERIEQFVTLFGDDRRLYRREKDSSFLDLGFAIWQQLTDTGVAPDNIETGALCTACHIGDFFSFRTDSKDFGKLRGEITGVIGLLEVTL